MAKLRWFKFFYIYSEAFKELSGRKCKKLILAMCNYAQFGEEPKKLDKHTQECFNSFKSLYEADMELYKIYGAKGGKNSHKPSLRGGSKNTKPSLREGY